MPRLKERLAEMRRDAERCTNLQLLETVISQAAGDDWDGSFTDDGKRRFEICKAELHKRLADWLDSIHTDGDDHGKA